MSRRRYIHDGSVIGDPSWIPKPWHAYIEWKRVACVMLPFLILLVTNPANQQAWRDYISPSTKKSKWLAPRLTNFGIFSLEEKIEGVVISGLQHHVMCPFKSPRFGSTCEVLADKLCHQKPLLWDTTDKAYTTHRLLCWVLILSSLYGFCCPKAPPRRFFAHPVADGLLASVFYTPQYLLHDLANETFCVYPTLVEMNSILPKLNRSSILCTGDETVDFMISVGIMIFLFGGGSNVIASRIDRQGSYITGFFPVIAAALGYYQRINVIRTSILMNFFGCDLTATRLYWSSIGWIILTNPNSWFPRLIAWLTAGLAGSFLAKYHLENIAGWGDVWRFFGMT
ncbi:hypothetical protein IV203_026876 [Nitzschia inconspicua]|uniref:Uncharacterized protein n=1 Tax=Nitzschia inconspicua TaxID=303405 RepID=A0A9K3LJG9_9STRA|nr:hypothetical protein IV203_026876 [Nitzschia inconspicua]